jgi:hypothetical protein
MLVSRKDLEQIATKIRRHITPHLEEKGFITDKEVASLIREHTGRNIASERSIGIIQEHLCEC